jgi:hypothetical protein
VHNVYLQKTRCTLVMIKAENVVDFWEIDLVPDGMDTRTGLVRRGCPAPFALTISHASMLTKPPLTCKAIRQTWRLSMKP